MKHKTVSERFLKKQQIKFQGHLHNYNNIWEQVLSDERQFENRLKPFPPKHCG